VSNEEQPHRPVRRVSERLARRDVIRRGGKWALAGALAPWVMGVSRAAAHPSESDHCGTFGQCDCDGTRCRRPDNTECRWRISCNGGTTHCWEQCYNSNRIKCCDYFCNGNKCHCCRQCCGDCSRNCC
jgi:hypothetical protein